MFWFLDRIFLVFESKANKGAHDLSRKLMFCALKTGNPLIEDSLPVGAVSET